MALVRRGYSSDRLRREYNQRGGDSLPPEQIKRLFGNPPLWFLRQNVGRNPAPTYAQFVPLLVDEEKREYTPVGAETQPTACYIRLPKSVTREQNTTLGRLTTPFYEVMDYPRPGQVVVLKPHGANLIDEARVWRLNVVELHDIVGADGKGKRNATGRVVFAQTVPQLETIETDQETQRRDQQLFRSIAEPRQVLRENTTHGKRSHSSAGIPPPKRRTSS